MKVVLPSYTQDRANYIKTCSQVALVSIPLLFIFIVLVIIALSRGRYSSQEFILIPNSRHLQNYGAEEVCEKLWTMHSEDAIAELNKGLISDIQAEWIVQGLQDEGIPWDYFQHNERAVSLTEANYLFDIDDFIREHVSVNILDRIQQDYSFALNIGSITIAETMDPAGSTILSNYPLSSDISIVIPLDFLSEPQYKEKPSATLLFSGRLKNVPRFSLASLISLMFDCKTCGLMPTDTFGNIALAELESGDSLTPPSFSLVRSEYQLLDVRRFILVGLNVGNGCSTYSERFSYNIESKFNYEFNLEEDSMCAISEPQPNGNMYDSGSCDATALDPLERVQLAEN